MITCGMCIALGHAARVLAPGDTARVARALSSLLAVAGGTTHPVLSAFGACVGAGILLARTGIDDEGGPGARSMARLFEIALAAAGVEPSLEIGAWLGVAIAAHMPVTSASARSALRNMWSLCRGVADAAASGRVPCPAWLAIGSLTVRCVVADILTVPDARTVVADAIARLEWDEFCCVALPAMFADLSVRVLCAPHLRGIVSELCTGHSRG